MTKSRGHQKPLENKLKHRHTHTDFWVLSHPLRIWTFTNFHVLLMIRLGIRQAGNYKFPSHYPTAPLLIFLVNLSFLVGSGHIFRSVVPKRCLVVDSSCRSHSMKILLMKGLSLPMSHSVTSELSLDEIYPVAPAQILPRRANIKPPADPPQTPLVAGTADGRTSVCVPICMPQRTSVFYFNGVLANVLAYFTSIFKLVPNASTHVPSEPQSNSCEIPV